MSRQSFDGIRATVMGLGILGGGVGVARYLAERGATVTVTDMRGEDELQSSIKQLAGLPIIYHLGGHDDRDFTIDGADMVVRNPGVRRDSRYLELARSIGVAVEMEMSIFFRDCPSRVIGVTGTKGKTTVTSLIGEMLAAWNPDRFMAGNMGISALEGLPRLREETPVVIELSSWQLEALDEHRLGPSISVITNFSEDHLDRYNGYEDYVQTKRTIAHHQERDGVVVFNADDPDVRKVRDQSPAIPMPFGVDEQPGNSAWMRDGRLHSRFASAEFTFDAPDQLSLAGPHGRLNALAAIAACHAYGVPEAAIAGGLAGFSGVENRLEEIGTARGVRFINDTSATAPVATVSALRLLAEHGGRVMLISGGSDKQSDLCEFLDTIASHAANVVLLPGSASDQVRKGLSKRGLVVGDDMPSMDIAVDQAFAETEPGDVVLLSPGLASFGLFRNEFDRGRQFRAAFHRLQQEHGT